MSGSELFPWTPASRWLIALLVTSAVAAQGHYGLARVGASLLTPNAARDAGDHVERSTAHRETRVPRRAVVSGIRGDDRARSRNQTLALLLLAAVGRSAV